MFLCGSHRRPGSVKKLPLAPTASLCLADTWMSVCAHREKDAALRAPVVKGERHSAAVPFLLGDILTTVRSAVAYNYGCPSMRHVSSEHFQPWSHGALPVWAVAHRHGIGDFIGCPIRSGSALLRLTFLFLTVQKIHLLHIILIQLVIVK